LDATVGGKKAAATSVECRVIFESCDSGFDGIESRTAASQYGIASFKGILNACLMGSRSVGGDSPSTTVNDQSRSVRGRAGHRNIVEHLAVGGRIWIRYWPGRDFGSSIVNEMAGNKNG
jgi:hypothetical protein